uniref:Uncharacterized protein n=1 Tax=Chrysemys picta bellii TaxID=8478 RepID=A0A8C3HSA5_CHRPI
WLLAHGFQTAAELGQRRGRGLVEQQRHGPRLLGPGDQHGVAAQHHRLVLQLVPVDPGEDAGQARVGHAVGDAVQQVEVARPARGPLLGMHLCHWLLHRMAALRSRKDAVHCCHRLMKRTSPLFLLPLATFPQGLALPTGMERSV